jgi:hypothetical protein
MMKGIQLNEILNSPLNQERIKVSGIDGLKKLADEQAAIVTKSRERPNDIRILHKVGNTSIDITLSNVTEMSAALQAIGYSKKGILSHIWEWIV